MGKHYSNNLKLRIGNEKVLWEKIIKEVEAKRYLGPFEEDDPDFSNHFDYFYQNPLGLVPKGPAKDLEDKADINRDELLESEVWNNPKNSRVIFHLSYNFNEHGLINSQMPEELCKVDYDRIDEAIIRGSEFEMPYAAKTDGVSAFSQIPIRKEDWNLMVMKARSPLDGKSYYFASKVLGFGHSISCRLFSDFMAAVVHIAGKLCDQGPPIFYLDDAICIAGSEEETNHQLRTFIQVCDEINYPLSPEKTIWATQTIVFLGMLLDFVNRFVSVPVEKRNKALDKIMEILSRKKVKMHQLQKLTGLLNFLGRVIVPGRAFTRRLYYKTAGLMQHHHLKVDRDIQDDLRLWLTFLELELSYRQPFMDFSITLQAEEIDLYSDASKLHGWGCCYKNFWCFGKWTEDEMERVKREECTIQMQEMLAFSVAVELFAPMLECKRIVTHCDNQAVVAMINNASTKCKVCMEMIRLVTLTSMKYNCRFFSKWISTKENGVTDALSRLEFGRFRRLAPNMDKEPLPPPVVLCPMKDRWWRN